MSILFNSRQFFTFATSVVLSFLLVAFMAFGATYVDTDSVGVATATPGSALSADGDVLAEVGRFENHVRTSYVTATSSLAAGGTTTPGGALGVKGAAFIDGFLVVSNINATSSLGVATATPSGAFGAKGAGLFEGWVSSQYYTSTSSDPSWLLGGAFGLGTTSPSVRLGVKGAAIVEGFVSAQYFTSTSTSNSWLLGDQFGLGTTTGVSRLSVDGDVLGEVGRFADHLKTGHLIATSTTATSTIGFGLTVDSDTLVVNANGNTVGVATTVFPSVGTTNETVAVNIGAGSASTSMFIAGGAAAGGSIILQSSTGSGCIQIFANRNGIDVGGSASDLATLLTAKVIACPIP